MDVEFLTVSTSPHSVIPGPHDDPVVGLICLDFSGFVAGEGAVAVFRVKESADPEHCRLDIF